LLKHFKVEHNAVKSIIFRFAEFLVAWAVYKFFSLLACRTRAFTAYIIFSEDYIQKALFVISRRFSGHGLLVLAFTIVYVAADLYGTLLWALDAPGYTAVKQNVTAASVMSSVLEHPGYLVQWSRPAGDVAALENELNEYMGAKLFKPGFNFTLTGENKVGRPVTVPPTRAFDSDVGPRIWLDDEGFSVSTDPLATVGFLPGGTNSTALVDRGYDCPKFETGDYTLAWNCTYPSRYAHSFLDNAVFGRPTIHWDDESDQQLEYTYLSPRRQDNPWQSLGKGGSTAVMKQIFTVTKGRTRHTFVDTAFKVAAITDPGVLFSVAEIEDLVRRTWYVQVHRFSASLQVPYLSWLVLQLQSAVVKALPSFLLRGYEHRPVACHFEGKTYNHEGTPDYQCFQAL